MPCGRLALLRRGCQLDESAEGIRQPHLLRCLRVDTKQVGRQDDAVIVTHAHLDHTGYLPALAAAGYRGPIHATSDTAALCGIVLPDSGHLQEEEADYANRAGFSKHRPAVPLYTEDDARAVLPQLRCVDFHDVVEVAPGVRATFRPAGHILGSAHVTLAVDDRTVVFSGDLGRPEHPLLGPPDPLPEADALVIESTYGNRTHEPREETTARLARAVRDAAARGGAIVIPAFAVDRTEMVLHELAHLVEDRQIPSLPVYVDSPMALATLAVYRRAIEDGRPDVRRELRPDAAAFAPLELHELRTPAQSKQLNTMHFPMIIVSASGMAAGGRVVHHLAHHLGDSRSAIVLVGFQAAGTRGRRLLDGERAVKLLGSYVRVRAQIVDATGMSSHADRGELVDWVLGSPTPPSAAFVVHGEPEASRSLQQQLGRAIDGPVAVPGHLERVVV
jgi:metallo-beta-lactamase family protein